jgi:hypothetical protein
MKQRSTKHTKEHSRVLGTKTFGAIAAIEGLHLSADGKKRISNLLTSSLSPDARRAEIVRAYSGKDRK